MATTKTTLSLWFDEGQRQKQAFMIVVCDTYDHGDYPVYATVENFAQLYEKNNRKNMQRIMEVYDLNIDKDVQMSEHRAFHYPTGWENNGKQQ